MGTLSLIKIVAALLTPATGLLTLVKPIAVYVFSGITAPGASNILIIKTMNNLFFRTPSQIKFHSGIFPSCPYDNKFSGELL